MKHLKNFVFAMFAMLSTLFFSTMPALAGEADLVVPSFAAHQDSYNLLVAGIVISALGIIIGIIQYFNVKNIKAHKSMLMVGNLIFETCKTYLVQQGKFLVLLEVLIAICIGFYFGVLQDLDAKGVLMILAWSVIGILGSYGVAWYGIGRCEGCQTVWLEVWSREDVVGGCPVVGHRLLRFAILWSCIAHIGDLRTLCVDGSFRIGNLLLQFTGQERGGELRFGSVGYVWYGYWFVG